MGPRFIDKSCLHGASSEWGGGEEFEQERKDQIIIEKKEIFNFPDPKESWPVGPLAVIHLYACVAVDVIRSPQSL